MSAQSILPPLVSLKNIVKHYELGAVEVKAVQGVSFSVSEGEFAAIVGPSGSGKTTLLNMIGCIEIPTSGNLIVDGSDTATLSDDELSSFRLNTLGFVF